MYVGKEYWEVEIRDYLVGCTRETIRVNKS